LHGEAVHLIGTRIVRGEYRPGDVLDPVALEHELDVSRTVIREALRVLAAKGMVGARPRRGTFVRKRLDWSLLDADVLRWQFDGTDSHALLRDLVEVRDMIEPAAAAAAARRRTDEDVAELGEALAEMSAAGDDSAGVTAADLRFHRLLLAATHNELLARMSVVIEIGLRARDELVHVGSSWSDPVPMHAAVLTAIRRRQPQKAASTMQALLAQAGREPPTPASRLAPPAEPSRRAANSRARSVG
jgi:DNA-binding FadR family transcriptional regulator